MMKNKCLLLFFLMLMVLSYKVLAERNEICFYADSNYTGESICAAEGDEVKRIMKNWNDRISSINVPKGMIISIYEDNDFSGRSITLRNNIDFLSHPDFKYFNDIISSFKIKYSACFYEYDRFEGKDVCLSGDEQTDLYNEKQYNISDSMNDRISSIRVPSAMQVTLYKDDRYNGDRVVLTEDFLLGALKELGMAFNISSITASQKNNFVCDRFCVVHKKMNIPIRSVFGQYWNDERIGPKQVLISLELTGSDDYLIWLSDNGLIRVKDRVIYYIHDYISNAAYYEMSSDSNRLSILSRFNGGYFESQFIESFNYEMRYLSPVIGYLFNPSKDDIHFSIMNFNSNENKSITIDKIVMTAEKAALRNERSIPGATTCWLIPILNIYNYIVQGECNQVDRFVGDISDFFNGSSDKILQISGSSKPLPNIDINKELIFKPTDVLSSDPDGTLTYIKAGLDKQSLTLLATALACKVSMKEQLLPHIRTRRDDSPSCINWTLDILTSFTLLFGDSLSGWNAENFGRVIDRILNHQDTGYAVSDIETETRLVRSVGAFIAANIDEDLIRIKTAFDFSQLSYANYLSHNNTESPVLPPQRSQELLLGRYELVLENFSYTETIPRIREAGQWVEHPELNFEIEIITGPPTETLSARQNVSPTIDEWHRVYRQPFPLIMGSSEYSEDIEPAILHARDSVIPASRIVSDVIQSWLRTSRDDYIYVIVRLSGKIVSITLAVDINETDMGIGGSLSDPAYVLHPLNEGTIRGAGTAAIKALAQFATKKGKRALVSDVISQPSAIVKKKVGFKFIEEL
ncbi:beta-gamma-crystallin [Yersinia massiliensis]|uniref:peptidase inhibitor family I36 protein n=1 Tax=Yersinia massiliensis TaxID=419257 RepID=UPI0005DCAA70|nr:peptidase inhibitor family I36 protein [Yersinia massiliensis]CNI09939.1 beta-gamma-crystallin [Yersinia massiliensis]